MGNVIDLFADTCSSNLQVPPPDSVDVTPIAWMPMHEIRNKAFVAEATSGRRALVQVFRMVARSLVFSQYAEPGEAGVYRAISADSALRRAVDLLDLADELEAEIPPAGGEPV